MEFGVSVTGSVVHIVAAFPGEMDAGLSLAAIEFAGHGAKAERAAALMVEGDIARTEKIDELAAPSSISTIRHLPVS